MEILKKIENGRFDLHLHTTALDGSFSPSKVVKMAAQNGLTTIAITDHDTIDGIQEAIETARKIGITIIPGIELSTKYKGKTIDILGYNIHETKELLSVLQKMREHRQNRCLLIINKFCELGMNITLEDVQKYSKGNVIARPHIAKAVIDKGYAKDPQEVFDLYLGDGKPCAADKLELSPSNGIELIHRAGGVAVLAHPLLIHDDTIVEELMQFHFDGIEVWHRKQGKEDIKRYKSIAKKYSKIMTGGSDFHTGGHEIGKFGFESLSG